ncbi:MAG: transglutaminase domain-containing protein [Oscillospiraceae bacterium]|nr:transglutaminase domain-containing protein [Oscillospiraceae bacterium]MDY6208107.1 transglutaminase domain-containing protein [Oscillospiraceae bacterium]
MHCSRGKNRIFCAAAALCFLLSSLAGCGHEDGITVISDGTTVEITESVSEDNGQFADSGLYIPQHMVTKYASLDYDARMQDAYDSVVNTIMNFETSAHMPLTISETDYVKVLETVRCEQLMLFYLADRTLGDFDSFTHSYTIDFSYKFSVDEVNDMLRETEQAAMDIISQLDEDMSDYEKLKFFHDYLVLNVESAVEGEYVDSVYGALVNKKALCEGYAKAFSYLCNLSGIENMIVTGYTGVDHMWNMVKLNGSWYHIDIGWDQPAEALKAQYPDLILYQYFLVNDDVIQNNRSINNYLCSPPGAEAETMNYFIHEGRYAVNYDEALDIIENSCRSCIDTGEKYFMLKFDSSNLCLQTISDLIRPDGNGISDIDRIVERLNFKGQISYIDYYKQYRILIFVVE